MGTDPEIAVLVDEDVAGFLHKWWVNSLSLREAAETVPSHDG